MPTDSSPTKGPFQLKVEDGVVICNWDYQADPDVKFTDAQVEQLDGPLPKRIYLYSTGGRAATNAFAALSATTATKALKAIAERADKMSMAYVRTDQGDWAEIERLEKGAEGDDETEPPYFTVRILTDDKEAVSEYVARRTRPFNFITPWPRYGVERPLPAVAVSVADNVAAITLEPHTAELSEETRASIVAADRQRVFIDARSLKPADYPQDTLAFLFSNATLVCVTAVDCSKPDAEADVEAAHAIFDTQAEDSPWVVRLFNDAPRDWGNFIEKHGPVGQHCLAWPTYHTEPAAG